MPKETIEALVKGGEATPAPPLGPSLSQAKLDVGKIVAAINEKTKIFNGIDVPVKIIIDTETRNYEISVGAPPITSLIKKELGIQKLATVGEDKIRKPAGNMTFEKIVSIAKGKEDAIIGKTFRNKIKQIIGTCMSCGVTIDGKDPKSVLKDIAEGKYDNFM